MAPMMEQNLSVFPLACWLAGSWAKTPVCWYRSVVEMMQQVPRFVGLLRVLWCWSPEWFRLAQVSAL
jgi:hypothetical protein